MNLQTTKPNATSFAGRGVGQAAAFHKALHSKAYPHREPKSSGRKVFTDDGRRRVCVGTLRGGVFTKRVRDSHILRKPRAIALQDEALSILREAGCHTVEAVLDGGKILRSPLERFATRGFGLDRGFGAQTALPLAQWDVDCGQTSLFGGAL